LIRKPVESAVNVFCRLACVEDSAFSAFSEEILLRIESMVSLLMSNSAFTEPVPHEVQIRTLEQVVGVTRNLSASWF
jgi:hypothetical protein